MSGGDLNLEFSELGTACTIFFSVVCVCCDYSSGISDFPFFLKKLFSFDCVLILCVDNIGGL